MRNDDIALEFAEYVDVEVEEWMLSDIWEMWVGCENCGEGGPEAPCWGLIKCHGPDWGCGCRDCAVEYRKRRREVREGKQGQD